MNKHNKDWRNIKLFYEQIIIIINGQEEEPDLLEWEQTIQYFMLNKFTVDLQADLIDQIIYGAAEVKKVALQLLCLFVNTIASSIKKEEMIMEMRNNFFF